VLCTDTQSAMFCAISGVTPEEPVVSAKSGLLYEKRLALKLVAEAAHEPGQQVRHRVSSLEERARAYRVHVHAEQSNTAVRPQRCPHDSGSHVRPRARSLADPEGFWATTSPQPRTVDARPSQTGSVLGAGHPVWNGTSRCKPPTDTASRGREAAGVAA
jgi:hypothetical protein